MAKTPALPRLIAAVLDARVGPLQALLRADQDLAALGIEQDVLVDAVPHWLYVGDSLLHLAAAATRPRAVRALIAAGADVNAANRRGGRPLHYACDPRPAFQDRWRPADQKTIITLLIAAGAEIEAADKSGVRALHRAVRARSPTAVRALLEAGADPGARAGKGSATPMQLAASTSGASGVAGTAILQQEITDALRAAENKARKTKPR